MDTAKRSGLFGLFNRNRTEASEEEIRSMVDDNQELEEDEKRMIHDVLDLSDARASDVMRPRVDMILTEDCDSIRVAYERMRGTGYSRLPVFHESHDDIVGVVRFKAVVPALLDGRDEDPVSSYMDDAMFVPESKDLMALLRAGTVRRVVAAWQERPECIAAAAHNGNRGNPCLFPARFFPELCALEADRGGSSVIRRHENVLLLVEAGERELFDCDTKQALEILKGNA